MPKVDLTATKDFTYMTRRLTAGDPFQARNPLEAKILTRVRKVAEVPSKTAEIVEPDGTRTNYTVGGRVEGPSLTKAAPAPRAVAKRAPAKRKARAKK